MVMMVVMAMMLMMLMMVMVMMVMLIMLMMLMMVLLRKTGTIMIKTTCCQTSLCNHQSHMLVHQTYQGLQSQC